VGAVWLVCHLEAAARKLQWPRQVPFHPSIHPPFCASDCLSTCLAGMQRGYRAASMHRCWFIAWRSVLWQVMGSTGISPLCMQMLDSRSSKHVFFSTQYVFAVMTPNLLESHCMHLEAESHRSAAADATTHCRRTHSRQPLAR
jgi:hypothetical protein